MMETVFKDSKTLETIIVMGFGIMLWIWAMRALLKTDEADGEKKAVASVAKKQEKQEGAPPITLTYITKEQIMELTADQLREVPESEVDKLPTALKDMFKKRRNEVLLADKAKKANK